MKWSSTILLCVVTLAVAGQSTLAWCLPNCAMQQQAAAHACCHENEPQDATSTSCGSATVCDCAQQPMAPAVADTLRVVDHGQQIVLLLSPTHIGVVPQRLVMAAAIDAHASAPPGVALYLRKQTFLI